MKWEPKLVPGGLFKCWLCGTTDFPLAFDISGLPPGEVWILEKQYSRVYLIRCSVTPHDVKPVFREFKLGWWSAEVWKRRWEGNI